MRVQGAVLRPRVPRVHVEEILRRGGSPGERLQAAEVVVELHPHGVEEHLGRQHRPVRGVRVRALRRRRQQPLGAGGCGLGVHQAAELLAECRHVGHGRLEVEVEAVDRAGAEGPRRRGVGRVGAENLPDVVGGCDGCFGTTEAAFCVRCSSDREQDGFVVRGLTFCYVGSDALGQVTGSRQAVGRVRGTYSSSGQ